MIAKIEHFWFYCAVVLAVLASERAYPSPLAASGILTNSFAVSSVTVQGKVLVPSRNGVIDLGVLPENIVFHFEPATNLGRLPIRIRYLLDGYEKTWHEGGGSMFVGFRFYNQNNEPIDQPLLEVTGQSSGWNGSLTNSALTHRHEVLTAPPHAAHMSVIISSAGPPATEGIYVVANLVISRKFKLADPSLETIVLSPFDHQTNIESQLLSPHSWMRDGNHATMAKTVRVGSDSSIGAFAIFDDDPISHAEWRFVPENLPVVSAGDSIIVDWNEMYSIGVGDTRLATYNALPSGSYLFRVEELDLLGAPTGVGAVLKVLVPEPFWRTTWFWGCVSLIVIVAGFGTGRYLTWHRLKAEMLRLKHQQELERERLRIAHDIHDDLGARVTQISLVSALAERNVSFPDAAQTEFRKVTFMARELVSALYETVWAVNPENDNLEALGNYLCQMVNRLCEQTQFRCRFYVSDLPKDVQVSSQVRHNVSMAVKEAVHNVIKHANASQVEVQIDYHDNVLSLYVRDDGKGFDSANPRRGNGLFNLKHRCENIGGQCSIFSNPGKGTTIKMTLTIKPDTQSKSAL